MNALIVEDKVTRRGTVGGKARKVIAKSLTAPVHKVSQRKTNAMMDRTTLHKSSNCFAFNHQAFLGL